MHIQAARAARFSAPKTEEEKEAAAKAAAKKAGRPYPNLVDNMRAARKK